MVDTVYSPRGYGYEDPRFLNLACPVEGCLEPLDEWDIIGNHLKTVHGWSYEQLNDLLESLSHA